MVSNIKLQQFRNHGELEIPVTKRTVLLTGANTRGKTNILEALYVAGTGSSFRTHDEALIRTSDDWARIDVQTAHQLRTVKFKHDEQGLQKLLEVDNQPVRTRPKFQQGFAVVLFEPEELRMLLGSPELRRAWLDRILVQTDPHYARALNHYARALRQRNRLLKTAASEDHYFVWELKLSEYGATIATKRHEIARTINEVISRLYTQISGGTESLSCRYDTPAGDYATWLARALRTGREHDIRLGHTTIGPHREDLVLLRDGALLAESASRGELRNTVLALKLFEVHYLENALGIQPVLLLDDVFGELDSRRQKALLRAIAPYQAFITATEQPREIEESLQGQLQVVAV